MHHNILQEKKKMHSTQARERNLETHFGFL